MIAGIIIGIIAGFIACKLTNREGKGCIIDLLLGIVGGAVGGWRMALRHLGNTRRCWNYRRNYHSRCGRGSRTLAVEQVVVIRQKRIKKIRFPRIYIGKRIFSFFTIQNLSSRRLSEQKESRFSRQRECSKSRCILYSRT